MLVPIEWETGKERRGMEQKGLAKRRREIQ